MIRLNGGVLMILVVMVSGGCLSYHPSGSSSSDKKAKTPRDEFAADSDVVPFDAKRAMGYLESVCKIGPRISGTAGMTKQQDLLRKHFEELGGKIEWQRFDARQKSQRDPVPMANLIVSWHPERKRRVIICSHYDTRPKAHEELDRRKWNEPFISANDGGSGVALMMELAHHIKDLKTAVGVDFVFFDGEEYIFDRDNDEYFFGSKHFAEKYKKSQPRPQYLGAVLLDMVGGKNAHFRIEPYSFNHAGALVQDLWKIAGEQNCDAFIRDFQGQVLDDHIALNQAGIPAVDLIDFTYPHWHKLTDVPANCSGDSLNQVARVLTTWLQRVK